MTQEEKQLLLKDLSARLNYKVNLDVRGCRVECLHHLLGIEGWLVRVNHYKIKEDGQKFPLFIENWVPVDEVKPYLRPMSSMTHDEDVEYMDVLKDGHYGRPSQKCASVVDWLNEHHFDYRGLIEKGLAIEVTKENNPYKKD